MTLGESSSSSSKPLQAELAIDFLVVGGSVSGLAAAYALRRVGHRVLALEAGPDFFAEHIGAGIRMPPNMSKVFYHWGLEEELQKIGRKSSYAHFRRFESGELLGRHMWEEELMQETGGDFVLAHHSDLRRFLYDHALEAGVKFRANCRVVAIDPKSRRVTLQSGEVLKADVIIGADGWAGCSRKVVLQGKQEQIVNTGISMYNSLIPIAAVRADPELASYVPPDKAIMSAWFGNKSACLLFELGGRRDMSLHMYVPETAGATQYGLIRDVLIQKVGEAGAEKDLKKLVALAGQITRIPVLESPDLPDWVHDDGPLLLIGDGAHAMPPGSIQSLCMGIEDAAVLAKLFSHLLNYDQITQFLYAFQDLRQKRCSATRKQEFHQLYFMMLPDGPQQQIRDTVFRERTARGLSPLQDDVAGAYWDSIKETFCYDAEDEADNWWISWGLLMERAKRSNIREDAMTVLVSVNDDNGP